MKATGIVRRIDDLGRVVIPKEIRRTLRIREGDPLEIYTGTDGGVIFKKYSPIGELSEFSGIYCDVLAKVAEVPTLICDKDHIVAVAGAPKNEYIERRITPALEELMESRKNFVLNETQKEEFFPIEGVSKSALIAFPINSAGDVTGAIIMLKNDKVVFSTEVNVKLAQAAAMFLGKQMET